MPLWSVRSCLYRAIRCSYAFNGGSRPAARVGFTLTKARPVVLTNRRLPEPRRVVTHEDPLPVDLQARIDARVAREAAHRTSTKVTFGSVTPRPAATKPNGGVRGSLASRWAK